MQLNSEALARGGLARVVEDVACFGRHDGVAADRTERGRMDLNRDPVPSLTTSKRSPLSSLSALIVMMQNAGVRESAYRRNVVIALVAMLYSVYAIYASGANAVLGGTVVMGLGFVIFGFLAPRFVGTSKTSAHAEAPQAA